MADVAAQLTKVPRFADLSRKDLKRLAAKGRVVHLPSQWSLMSETTPADKAYVILSGTCEVRHQGKVLATIGPGDIVGEVGILEKKLRTAAVVSMSELEVVHFTREDLAALVEEIPALGAALRATAKSHEDQQG